jgi:hypothetical protein
MDWRVSPVKSVKLGIKPRYNQQSRRSNVGPRFAHLTNYSVNKKNKKVQMEEPEDSQFGKGTQFCMDDNKW